LGAKVMKENPTSARAAESTGGDLPWTAWTSGYGRWSRVTADAATAQGKVLAGEGGGAFGVERQLGNAKAGLMVVVGEGLARVSDSGLRVRSDSWGLGGYGSMALGALTLDSSVLMGSKEFSSRRDSLGDVVTADYQSKQWSAALGMTLNLAPASSEWLVAPVLRLNYAHSSQDAFQEQGSLFASAFDKRNKDSVSSRLGTRIAKTASLTKSCVLCVSGAAYWGHDYSKESDTVNFRVGTSRFSAPVRRQPSDSALFDLGVQATFAGRYSAGIQCRQEFNSQMAQTTGVFTVGIQF